MVDLADIFVKAIFAENMIFAYFLGMCSYLAVSKNVKTAVGLGAAVIFVLLLTVPANWAIQKFFLNPGALRWTGIEALAAVDLSFLSFILYIAVIASVVQLVEMVVEKFSPALYGALGIFLPLIAVNCSILGGSLFMGERGYAFTESIAFSLGSGIGWFLAIVGIAAIREKIQYSNVPPPLRGLGITFIITGLMGLAFMSFQGISL
ncbi:MAG: NADH:ubiquinone reductase (Na(+)-transporting) subunit E [Bacteroidia bacterium]